MHVADCTFTRSEEGGGVVCTCRVVSESMQPPTHQQHISKSTSLEVDEHSAPTSPRVAPLTQGDEVVDGDQKAVNEVNGVIHTTSEAHANGSSLASLGALILGTEGAFLIHRKIRTNTLYSNVILIAAFIITRLHP